MTSPACPQHNEGIHSSYCPRSDTERYPVCEKLNAVRNDKAILLCFLEWLEENNLKICRSVSAAGYFPVYSPEKLLMEYFGIDEKKLEEERQKILKEQRKLNEKTP